MRKADVWASVQKKLISAVRAFRVFLQANREHLTDLDKLHCDVVLLASCERVNSLLDWKLNEEGLYMRSEEANYLMLPDRPAELKLSKEDAVRYCAKKAKIELPEGVELGAVSTANAFRIRTSCASASYAEAVREFAGSSPPTQRASGYLNWRILLVVGVVLLAMFFIRWGEVEYDIEYDAFLANYEALGLEQTATLQEVKKAYRRLSVTRHPDKVTNCDTACHEAWLKITRAHQQIVDFDRGVLKLKRKTEQQT